MATEAKGDKVGLVRRVGSTAATMFDDGASRTQRVTAGATVVGGATAVIGGSLAVGDAFNAFVLNNPAIVTGLHSALTADVGLGAAIGAGAGVLTYGGRWFCADESNDRLVAHSAVGKVRVAAVAVAGVAALLAAGIGVTDSVGITNAVGLDHTLIDTAMLVAGGAGGMSALRLVTRIGIQKPAAPQAQLGE